MKKRKLNWVSVGNMVGLIASLGMILKYFYSICILPFFKKQLVGITPFGFIVLILAFIVFGANFNYFEKRIKYEK